MMDEMLAALRVGMALGVAGSIIAFAVSATCRWLNWAPVNITVNIYRANEEQPE